MSEEFHFNDAHDAKAEIRAAVRYLVRNAADHDHGDIVRQVTAIVREEAGKIGPGPLDEGMPGG